MRCLFSIAPGGRPARRARVTHVFAATAAASVSINAGFTSTARAANKTWVGATGNWSLGANWNGGTIPASGDAAFIRSATGNVTLDAGAGTPSLSGLLIDGGGTLSFATGTAMTTAALQLGGTGAGVLNVTNTNNSLAVTGGITFNSGTFAVSGSALSFGTFSQLGGSTVLGGWLQMNNASSYTLAGGSLSNGTNTTSQISVGYASAASFNQTGGLANVLSFLTVGDQSTGSGTYSISGGTLNLTGANPTLWVSFAGTGTFNQTGGTVTTPTLTLADQLTGNGTYLISDGSLGATTAAIGLRGNGHFVQTGGTVTINNVNLTNTGTNGVSALSVSGASANFNAGTINVGTRGSFNNLGGTVTFVAFNQSAGNSSFSDLVVGRAAGSTSAFNLSGGAAGATDTTTIGDAGAGTFNQTGGTMSANLLTLGGHTGGAGTYLLSAGTLTAFDFTRLGFLANGTLLQSGGTFQTTTINIGGPSAAGYYHLTAGALSAATVNLASGTLQVDSGPSFQTRNIAQAGGDLLRPVGSLTIGDTTPGQYQLNGGSFAVQNLYFGTSNDGTMLVNGGGGSAELAAFGFGGNGTLAMSGGSININKLGLGESASAAVGELAMSGGTLTVPGLFVVADVGNATVAQSGGVITAAGGEVIGNIGNATFNQTGGTNVVTGSLQFSLGSGTGRYILNGGTLLVGSIAGPANAIDFQRGSLSITNGSLSIGPNGPLGTDLVLTSSRVLSVAGGVNVAPFWSLTLQGGTLSAGTIAVQSGGTFAFDGGTLRLTASDFVIGTGGLLGNSVELLKGQRIETTPGYGAFVASGAALALSGGAIAPTLGTTVSGQLLLNSPLSSVEGGQVIINSSGLLGGTGRITPAVANLNGAEVRVGPGDALQFTGAGGLNSSGLVNQTGGELDVAAQFGNTGTVALAAGLLQVGSLSNFGTINLTGGQLQLLNGGTNASTGRIAGRGTMALTNLQNSGTIALSAGLSDVSGTVTQASGAKTIITGGATATFYDAVTNAAGSEFRVSANSTAAFLGNVTGLSQFTGPGTKDFEGAAATGALMTAAGSSVVGPAGTLTATAIREAALTVEGVASVLPDGTAAATSRVNQLSIDGAPDGWTGRLDLANNALVIDYAGSSPIGTIQNQLKSGFANGSWTGNGITSSAAAATATSGHRTELGYAEASQLGTTSFSGQFVDNTSLLVRYTLAGDSNLDGHVDLTDFTFLAANFNGTSRGWLQGDYNYDGQVDLTDFTLLASNFNQTLSTGAGSLAPLGATVPEPGAAIASALALVCGISRRRRR
jgi:hypothetical protein